tara:strand:+ start:564 stop:1370 length:807 start_codon:yes stop_codon:yes gene_type:complete
MSIKIEVKGGFLKITNENESVDRFIKAITNYHFDKEQVFLFIKEPQGSNQVTHKYRVLDLVDSEGNPFFTFSDLDSFLEENLGSFNIAGDSSASTTDRVVAQDQVYDITKSNDGNMVQLDFDGDWAVALPLLSTVEENFKVVLVHNRGIGNKGSIVPYYSDIVNGAEIEYVYGKGFLTLEKVGESWVVINKSLFSNYHLEGVTKRYDFENETEVLVQHNLGYVPLIEVWIEEDAGYSRANLDIQHDWNTMNSFNVCIGSSQSGKVIYL